METPVAVRSAAAAAAAAAAAVDGVVDDTPIKTRLFGSTASAARDGLVAETPERKGGGTEREREREVDIYQRLGWDMGDFDDI